MVSWHAEGLSWKAKVAVHVDSGTPGIVDLRVSRTDDRPDALSDGTPFRSGHVDLLPLGMASTISFGPASRPEHGAMPLPVYCHWKRRRWAYYMSAALTADPSVGERRTSRDGTRKPDDETIARCYLEAIEEDRNPIKALRHTLGCTSDDAARKWIQRAGERGWLSAGSRGRGFRRSPGPRLTAG